MQYSVIVGTVVEDPSEGRTRNDHLRLRMRVKCESERIGRDGEVQTSSLWVTVRAFGRLAESLNGRVREGSTVAVRGRMGIEKFRGRDGNERTMYVVDADEVEVIKPAHSDSGGSRGSERGRGGSGRGWRGRDWDDDSYR